jgi:cytochrome c-type biogenesis protein CcmH/NrfG
MKSDAVAFGVAGILFGLIAGWIIGSQQAALKPPPAAQSAAATPQPSQPPSLDEARVKALQSVADREPKNAGPRVELGNLYFDAERYSDAANWYAEALKLSPSDVEVSTDLGVAYYYTNQPDRALAQFDQSLKLDPRHAKTILNVGVVKAFAKQDLEGAEAAWREVVELAPDSPEGQTARRALESLRAAHKPSDGAQKPGG